MTVSETYVAPQNWQPPAPRPPLTPRQKSGARLAGILGYILLSIGFGLFALPVVLLAFGAFFTLLIGFIRRVSGNDADFERFLNGFESLNPTAWILPLIIVAFVGLVIMAVALFVSARILRNHDVARPWAVTWAGAGIAIVASWFVSGLTAIPFSLSSGIDGGDSGGAVVLGVAVGILSGLVGIAVTAVTGWLAWWWMAHAFRSSPTAITPT